MEASYEFFDHTADMGIRVRAETIAALVPMAAGAFYAAVGELVAGGDSRAVSFDLSGGDQADLLRDFLTELLVLFERDAEMVSDITVEAFEQRRLTVSGAARRIDKENSVFDREVKAITYHELAIEKISGGYEATIIIDI